VCVIGLGLIGGSVLRAAVAAGRSAWGATASAETAAAAAADGFDVEPHVDAALGRAAAQDALVVLAVPLPALPAVLARVAKLPPGVRLTDVVSVKAPVAAAVRRLAPAARYVGGHPMAGTAESGWAAGSAGLFAGAAWVVAADDGLDLDIWADVAELAWDLGARVVPAAAAEHDEAVARVSHLPHLLAAVLAAVGADGADESTLPLALAAGSFADGTRVAGTRPELVLSMCEGNRPALLAAVDDALGRLGAMRGSLASTGGLAATVNAGHHARQRWEQARHPAELRIALDEPDALARLREVGRRGDVLVGWPGETADELDRRRWDTDETFVGIADGAAIEPAVEALLEHVRRPGWITEDPDVHLLPHLAKACAAADVPWELLAAELGDDGVYTVHLHYTGRGRIDLLRDAVRLLASVGEPAYYVRQVDPSTVDCVTGVLEGDGPFATHGHLIRLRLRQP
jgi:prephenate dehydrogenase